MEGENCGSYFSDLVEKIMFKDRVPKPRKTAKCDNKESSGKDRLLDGLLRHGNLAVSRLCSR